VFLLSTSSIIRKALFHKRNKKERPLLTNSGAFARRVRRGLSLFIHFMTQCLTDDG